MTTLPISRVPISAQETAGRRAKLSSLWPSSLPHTADARWRHTDSICVASSNGPPNTRSTFGRTHLVVVEPESTQRLIAALDNLALDHFTEGALPRQ
jgi:hypothetical protein